ncbi:alginate O-acetyltransferase AlgF [Marinobacter szutsaonensis]
MRPLFKALSLLLVFLLTPLAAQAGEDALYAAEAPDGAAFIRVVNADIKGTVPEASIGGKSLKDIEPLQASPYIYLPEGGYQLSVAGRSAEVTMAKNQFYTAVVMDSGELMVLEDQAFNNPRKALISFYNLTPDSPVSLKTADGKVEVIQGLESMDVANREINAVKVSLGAFDDGQALATTPPVNLQRGKVFSFFALEVEGSPRLIVSENKVDTSI